MLDRRHHAAGSFQRLIAPLTPHLRHSPHPAPPSRPSVTIVARNIRAAEVRSSIGCEKRRQRPPTLPADCRHRRLVARIHIGTLIAIHLYSNKKVVDERSNLRIFIRFAVHHMAPVAPHGPNVEQDWLVLSPRPRKRRLAPRVPPHRLMPRRAQIRGRRVFELIVFCGSVAFAHELRIQASSAAHRSSHAESIPPRPVSYIEENR